MPPEEAYVLSPTDVRNIRTYVQHKYAAMPHDERAEIVADAVTRIIHKQLPAFEEPVKRMITSQLIRTAVMERQSPVKADDIFDACLALDLSEEHIADPIYDWIEIQLQSKPDRKQLILELDKLAAERRLQGARPKARSNATFWSVFKRELGAEPQYALQHIASKPYADVIPMPMPSLEPIRRMTKRRMVMYFALCLALIAASALYGLSLAKPSSGPLQPPVAVAPSLPLPVYEGGLPEELRYRTVNEAKLIEYLETKSSLLAERAYFDAIIDAARSFDIHPVLLFAITGQEQAFVPKTHKQARTIANNPFNVFHSWKDFNTTIDESAEIAARTITNISKDRPEQADALTWINRTYAEDPRWSDGVRQIFATITAYVEQP